MVHAWGCHPPPLRTQSMLAGSPLSSRIQALVIPCRDLCCLWGVAPSHCLWDQLTRVVSQAG